MLMFRTPFQRVGRIWNDISFVKIPRQKNQYVQFNQLYDNNNNNNNNNRHMKTREPFALLRFLNFSTTSNNNKKNNNNLEGKKINKIEELPPDKDE